MKQTNHHFLQTILNLHGLAVKLGNFGFLVLFYVLIVFFFLIVSSDGNGIQKGVCGCVGGYQADSEPPPHGVVCQSLKQQNIILSAKNYLYRFYTWVKLVIVQTRN